LSEFESDVGIIFTSINCSTTNLAGLSDPSGRVLGLMPHTERFLFATQHPHWTRLGLRGE
jgi:phosphoribosylformylglycinamidine synthase